MAVGLRRRAERGRRWSGLAVVLWMFAGSADAGVVGSLSGSRASLERQVRGAQRNAFTLLETEADVRRFVTLGLLVPVKERPSLRLRGASFPVARPEVRVFLERLGRQHRQACGQPLVVTSLTRPASHQPRNAYRHSVHRAGMAVDLRRNPHAGCRRWLESTLRSLEARGVVEATLERHPPHYHVAVFPRRYERYVASLGSKHDGAKPQRRARHGTYVVQSGDTLWDIAREHGTTVKRIREINALEYAGLSPGQTLKIPNEL